MKVYDEPRSVLGDRHAARCLRLRKTLPCLEMPCVRVEVAWSILSDFDNLIINEAFVDVNSTDPNEIIGMWNENTNKILSTFVPVPTDGSISMVMQKLWHRCVDFRRWAPACETLDDYLELLDGLD